MSATTTPPSPDAPDEAKEEKPAGLGLSIPQVTGSALAAVSAAVAASWLGVAGTIIGAAVGSVIATVGSAVYAQTLRQSREAVRKITPSRDGKSVRVGEVTLKEKLQDLPWKRVLAAAGVVLVIALAAITVFEQISGKSVSSVTRGESGKGGTTVGSVFGNDRTRDEDRQPDSEPTGQPTDGATTDPSDPAQPSDPAGTPTAPTDEETSQPEPTPTPTPTPTSEPTTEPSPTSDPTVGSDERGTGQDPNLPQRALRDGSATPEAG